MSFCLAAVGPAVKCQCTLLLPLSLQVFVFVRQFRPAVFVKSEAAQSVPWTPETVPENEYSTEHGLTYELCAGIIGKNCVLCVSALTKL